MPIWQLELAEVPFRVGNRSAVEDVSLRSEEKDVLDELEDHTAWLREEEENDNSGPLRLLQVGQHVHGHRGSEGDEGVVEHDERRLGEHLDGDADDHLLVHAEVAQNHVLFGDELQVRQK